MNDAIDYPKKACPKIEIIGPFENQDKAEVAYSLTQDLLTRHLNLKMVDVTTGGPFGVAKAVQDQKLVGKVGVVGFDHTLRRKPYASACMNAPSDKPLLRLNRVGKAYAGVPVLRGISLEIYPAQALAKGKQTLLLRNDGLSENTLLEAAFAYDQDAAAKPGAPQPQTMVPQNKEKTRAERAST